MVAVIRVIDDGLPEPPRKSRQGLRGLRQSRTATKQANAQRKSDLLELVVKGAAIPDALHAVDRSRGWYNVQRANDAPWAALVDRARMGDRYGGEKGLEAAREDTASSFEEFCKNYLNVRVFEHQRNWIDLLEGRKPRGLHPSCTFTEGDPDYIIINTPPDHAKSTTLSVNYVTYLIATNPDIRICVVSKAQHMAAKFCYQVQQRLTHSRYGKLQATFGPPGGYKSTSDKWTATSIAVGGEMRRGSEGDANLRCIGVGQQIYGARLDLLILDDCVDTANAHEFEKQINWLQGDVLSRPGDSGKVLVVGTRVAPKDLYKELRNPERYTEGKSPWTYMSQPAVLEFNEDPALWVTLWPRSDAPWKSTDVPDADGLYRRWDGKALNRKRGLVGTRKWAFCYQQQDLAEDSVFPAELVRRAVNGMRSPGVMHRGAVGYRKEGMNGLYVVGGVDPAMTGDTGIVVVGIDRFTGIRYLLDAKIKTAASPTWIRETIKETTTSLLVNEWRIEKNAFQKFLSQDPELQVYLANLGVTIVEHFTGSGKWDEAWGVASMSLLFQNNLIEFPSTAKSEAVRQLVEQLVTWAPDVDKNHKTDMVMALWFANIKCQEIMQSASGETAVAGFLPNRFLSRRRRAQQYTVNTTDLAYMEAG
jgi:hypothetical protein